MSVNETHRSVSGVIRRYMDPPGSRNASSTHHFAMKTPQSKYGPSVLISATATRVNGRIAVTPRTADTAPCTLAAREKRRNTVTETPSRTPMSMSLKSSYSSGRRLPMNMVVSQIASRRAPSPVKELQEWFVSEEPPPLDPFLDHLLNFTTPGSKTGSLPHPDDLMGSRARKFRRIEGPEDEIHKAFVSIYGDAEASLSSEKKLRMTRNSESDSVLLESNGKSNQHHEIEQLVSVQHSSREHDSSSHVPSAPDTNANYRELYGVTPRSTAAVATRTELPNSPSEMWRTLEASTPPRQYISSHNFLKTASDLYYKPTTSNTTCYNNPPAQESTWTKYMTKVKQEEKETPWDTESLGKSNQKNYGTSDFKFKLSYTTSPENYFKFMPRSPAKPGPSPTVGHDTRTYTNARNQGGSSGLPESAECRWLYEVSPRRDVTPRHTRRYEDLPREDNDREDEEIANLFQAEKESLFSSTPTECSAGENKDDFFNYSSEE